MPTSALSFRQRTPDDAGITLTLFERAMREVASRKQIETWAGGIDRATWAAVNKGRSTWIATMDDTPLGFADLPDEEHLDRLLSALIISPAESMS